MNDEDQDHNSGRADEIPRGSAEGGEEAKEAINEGVNQIPNAVAKASRPGGIHDLRGHTEHHDANDHQDDACDH